MTRACHSRSRSRSCSASRSRRSFSRRNDHEAFLRQFDDTATHLVHRDCGRVRLAGALIHAMAGYSGTPLAKKLGIGPGLRVAAPGAPANYRALLAPMPDGVTFTAKIGKTTDIAHVF